MQNLDNIEGFQWRRTQCVRPQGSHPQSKIQGVIHDQETPHATKISRYDGYLLQRKGLRRSVIPAQ